MYSFKKAILVLGISLACLSNLHSQMSVIGNVKVSWGESYEILHHAFQGVLGNPKEEYAEIFENIRNYTLFRHYDTTFTYTGTDSLKLMEDIPKGTITGTLRYVSMKDNFWWIYATTDKKAHTFRIQAKKLSLKPLQLGNEIILLETGNYDLSHIENLPTVQLSSDASKLFIKYTVERSSGHKHKNVESNGMYVFDEHMNKLGGREFSMPYPEAGMEKQDFQVDKTGDIYLAAKVYDKTAVSNEDDDSPAPEERKPSHFELFKFNYSKDMPDIIPFSLDKRFTNHLELRDDDAGNIYCAGFYSGTKSGPIQGAFLFKLNTAGNTAPSFRKGYYDLPSQLLESYESKRTQNKIARNDRAGSIGLRLHDLRMMPDGSVTIAGEEQEVGAGTMERSTPQNQMPGQSQTHFTYNDIYVFQINPAGNLAWARKIPKNQEASGSSKWLSYKLFVKGNECYFFFLDNAENIHLNPGSPPAVFSPGHGGVLMCYRIDSQGMLGKNSLSNLREDKKFVSPRELVKANSNTLIGSVGSHEATHIQSKDRTFLSITIE